jgi:glucose-1-phosphate thymidylyltransferase
MIYYPVRKLVGAGITDIMLVSGTEHMGGFVSLLGSGKELGCSLTYRVQDEAGGIAQALDLARDFCAGVRSVVILGDNIFYDPLGGIINLAECYSDDMAWVILKGVDYPGRYGVAELDQGQIVGIEEKPAQPKSEFAVTGIYIYPPDVFTVIPSLQPSARGELEITDVNLHYLKKGQLMYTTFGDYWTDAGTPESLAEANKLVNAQPPRF